VSNFLDQYIAFVETAPLVSTKILCACMLFLCHCYCHLHDRFSGAEQRIYMATIAVEAATLTIQQI
jgi:hypothetical protein